MIIMRNNTPIELTNDEIFAASKAYTRKQIEDLLLHHANETCSDLNKDEKFQFVENMASNVLEKCTLMSDEIIKKCVDDVIREYQKNMEHKPCCVKVVFHNHYYEAFKELTTKLESVTFQSRKDATDAINNFIMEVFSKNPNHTYAIRKNPDNNIVEIREKGSAIIKIGLFNATEK